MVYLSLAEEIEKVKAYVSNSKGLELALFHYLQAKEHTQTIDEFDYEEHKIAYKGYSHIEVEREKIEVLLSKKHPKGIDYSLNIYCFIGIHLAADGYKKEIIEKRFMESDLKTKYIISTAFPEFKEKLSDIMKSDTMENDSYHTILKVIHTEGYSLGEVKQIIHEFLTSSENLDAIDLTLLIEIHKKFMEVSICEYSAIDALLKVLNNFSNSIKRITNDRYNKRKGIEITDEYDVQDILFVLLKGFFYDLEREDPVPKLAGKSSRIDLNIKSQGIMIEVKMIKSKDNDHKKYVQELKQDIVNYSEWKELKYLVLFIYDPYNRTTDDNHFKELEGINERNGVRYYVHSVLAK